MKKIIDFVMSSKKATTTIKWLLLVGGNVLIIMTQLMAFALFVAGYVGWRNNFFAFAGVIMIFIVNFVLMLVGKWFLGGDRK